MTPNQRIIDLETQLTTLHKRVMEMDKINSEQLSAQEREQKDLLNAKSFFQELKAQDSAMIQELLHAQNKLRKAQLQKLLIESETSQLRRSIEEFEEFASHSLSKYNSEQRESRLTRQIIRDKQKQRLELHQLEKSNLLNDLTASLRLQESELHEVQCRLCDLQAVENYYQRIWRKFQSKTGRFSPEEFNDAFLYLNEIQKQLQDQLSDKFAIKESLNQELGLLQQRLKDSENGSCGSAFSQADVRVKWIELSEMELHLHREQQYGEFVKQEYSSIFEQVQVAVVEIYYLMQRYLPEFSHMSVDQCYFNDTQLELERLENGLVLSNDATPSEHRVAINNVFLQFEKFVDILIEHIDHLRESTRAEREARHIRHLSDQLTRQQQAALKIAKIIQSSKKSLWEKLTE